MHYKRQWKGQPVGGAGRLKTGPKTLGYAGAHRRLGKVSGACACGRPAQEWAYDHADPDALYCPLGRPYSADASHYAPSCRSCHRTADRRRTKDPHNV